MNAPGEPGAGAPTAVHKVIALRWWRQGVSAPAAWAPGTSGRGAALT
jgi:hypothetical protein